MIHNCTGWSKHTYASTMPLSQLNARVFIIDPSHPPKVVEGTAKFLLAIDMHMHEPAHNDNFHTVVTHVIL